MVVRLQIRIHTGWDILKVSTLPYWKGVYQCKRLNVTQSPYIGPIPSTFEVTVGRELKCLGNNGKGGTVYISTASNNVIKSSAKPRLRLIIGFMSRNAKVCIITKDIRVAVLDKYVTIMPIIFVQFYAVSYIIQSHTLSLRFVNFLVPCGWSLPYNATAQLFFYKMGKRYNDIRSEYPQEITQVRWTQRTLKILPPVLGSTFIIKKHMS
ncbi:hypothetical protein BDC45DRAFT_596415 [Circinella umbellata]|nr:hypothetical protein BDC45DRAFT_596415 [Circinella umbellata]